MNVWKSVARTTTTKETSWISSLMMMSVKRRGKKNTNQPTNLRSNLREWNSFFFYLIIHSFIFKVCFLWWWRLWWWWWWWVQFQLNFVSIIKWNETFVGVCALNWSWWLVLTRLLLSNDHHRYISNLFTYVYVLGRIILFYFFPVEKKHITSATDKIFLLLLLFYFVYNII
mgnify:CR=1 FL=1